MPQPERPVLSETEPEPVTVPPPAPEPDAVPVALQPASEPRVVATIMQISSVLLMLSSIEAVATGLQASLQPGLPSMPVLRWHRQLPYQRRFWRPTPHMCVVLPLAGQVMRLHAT